MGYKSVNHQSLKKFYCSTLLHFNSFKPKAAYPESIPMGAKEFFSKFDCSQICSLFIWKSI